MIIAPLPIEYCLILFTIEKGLVMNDVYKALGWQGGTIRQVVAEIARLRDVEAKARRFGSEVALADSCGQLAKRNTGVRTSGKALMESIKG